MTPERPKVHQSTQTESFLHSITQYILEHPATVMLLLGIEPVGNLAPVMSSTVDYYDTRGRRPSALEQIAESENGSQSPTSTISERCEDVKSPENSTKDLHKISEVKILMEKDWKSANLKRNRYSASDLCEESERLLATRTSLPSTRSLKFNINN